MSCSFITFIIVDKDTEDRTVIQCDKKGLPIVAKAHRRNQHEMLKVFNKCNNKSNEVHKAKQDGKKFIIPAINQEKEEDFDCNVEQVGEELIDIEAELFDELSSDWMHYFNTEDINTFYDEDPFVL